MSFDVCNDGEAFNVLIIERDVDEKSLSITAMGSSSIRPLPNIEPINSAQNSGTPTDATIIIGRFDILRHSRDMLPPIPINHYQLPSSIMILIPGLTSAIGSAGRACISNVRISYPFSGSEVSQVA